MALPLGVATTIAALNLNVPRYFIHARLGERQLWIYSALAYATVAMIIVSGSLGFIARSRDRSLLFKLFLAGGATAMLVAVGSTFGDRRSGRGGWTRARLRKFRLARLMGNRINTFPRSRSKERKGQ